jgi:DNA-binding NarL/FixJ family response regulator
MTVKTKIALADDEVLIRKGIRTILEQEDNFEIVFEASNGLELLDFLTSTQNLPEIILMDIKMPELNGLETTKQIAKQFPNIKIIALSSYNSPTFVNNMLNVGAVCHIAKSASPNEMITTINLVIANGFYFKQSEIQYLNNNLEKTKTVFDADFLTKRELEVLQLICQQKTASEIAEILKISPRTVDGFRSSLLFKTDSVNVTGLVIFAIQNHLFSIEEDDFLKF